MKDDIDQHILHINFVEFLTSYLEGNTTLQMIFKMSERIRTRDQKTLSPSLITATTTLHNLKERIDRGEKIDKETITYVVDDILLDLTNY